MLNKFSVFVAGLAFASSAFSGVLLELKTSGGYVPEESWGWESGVKIEDNGWMSSFYRKNSQSPVQVRYLGVLQQSVVVALKSQINSLPASGSIEYPDGPECADIPTTQYTASMRGIEFSRKQNCKTGFLNGSWQARELSKVLDGIETLYQFQSRP